MGCNEARANRITTLIPIYAQQSAASNDGYLPMWYPARQRRHPSSTALHVFPHVLRFCQPRLCTANPSEDP